VGPILAALPIGIVILATLHHRARSHKRIWAELQRTIGSCGLIVGTTASQRGSVVGTFTKRHFAGFPGLRPGRYDADGVPLPRKASTEMRGRRGTPPAPSTDPQNLPHRIDEGATLNPDISLAMKSGHFHLQPTGAEEQQHLYKLRNTSQQLQQSLY